MKEMNALAQVLENSSAVIDVETPATAEKTAKAKRLAVVLPKKLVLSGVSYLSEKPGQKSQYGGSVVIEGTQFWLRCFDEAADSLYKTFGAPRVDNERVEDDERWPELGMRLGLITHEGAIARLYEPDEDIGTTNEFLAVDGNSALTGAGAILKARKMVVEQVDASQFEEEEK